MLKIFDNGETLDRFTILDTTTGDLYGASENPLHGFGQHCGNILQHYPDLGSNKKGLTVAVDRFLESFPDKQIRLADLPEAVKEYARMVRSYE